MQILQIMNKYLYQSAQHLKYINYSAHEAHIFTQSTANIKCIFCKLILHAYMLIYQSTVKLAQLATDSYMYCTSSSDTF